MPRILVDLTHNEAYKRIPSGIFGLDWIFDFIPLGDPFPTFDGLKMYDLVIMGEIIPASNEQDHLFLKSEVEAIKKYVYTGGKLLLTTSSGGDSEYKASKGSIRCLKTVTGVIRYWWGELFMERKGLYYERPENLIIPKLPEHAIFKDIRALLLVDSTFLEPSDDEDVDVLLRTKRGTEFRYYEDDDTQMLDAVPLIVSKSFGYGRSLTIGSSFFMTDHKLYGYRALDNRRFFLNILNWLIGS